jgi:hypothetical protein
VTSSFGSADVIVIGEAHDRVAAEVYQRCRAKGLSMKWPDRGAFARETSVVIDGGTASVDPESPILLRRQVMGDGLAADGRFLAAEAGSQLWAATALMRSPVINRPSEHGMPDWHPRVQVTRLRSDGRIDPHLLIPERHTDTPSLPSAEYESEYLWQPPRGTTGCGYRYRQRKPADWTYARCCVVGAGPAVPRPRIRPRGEPDQAKAAKASRFFQPDVGPPRPRGPVREARGRSSRAAVTGSPVRAIRTTCGPIHSPAITAVI